MNVDQFGIGINLLSKKLCFLCFFTYCMPVHGVVQCVDLFYMEELYDYDSTDNFDWWLNYLRRRTLSEQEPFIDSEDHLVIKDHVVTLTQNQLLVMSPMIRHPYKAYHFTEVYDMVYGSGASLTVESEIVAERVRNLFVGLRSKISELDPMQEYFYFIPGHQSYRLIKTPVMELDTESYHSFEEYMVSGDHTKVFLDGEWVESEVDQVVLLARVSGDPLTPNSLVMDAHRGVLYKGVRIKLSPNQHTVLSRMLEQPYEDFHYLDIYDIIYGEGAAIADGADVSPEWIRVFLSRFRQRLKPIDSQRRLFYGTPGTQSYRLFRN